MSPERFRLYAGVLPASVLFCLGVAANVRYFDEDALIIFRFARNLARDGQLAFNLGEPTYSLTCPAWGVLVGTLGGILGLAEHVRGVGIAVASLLGLAFLGQVAALLRPAGLRWVVIGTCVLALDPYLVWCAAVGNELPGFLVVSAVVFGLARRAPAGIGSGARLGSLVALAYLFRPEAVLMVPVLGFAFLLERRPGGGRAAIGVALGAACAVVPWLVFAQSYYGQFVPLTVEAKAAVSDSSWLAPLQFLVTTGVKAYGPACAALVLALLGTRATRLRSRENTVLLLWSAAVVVFYVVGLREHMMANRYLVVFGPALVLAVILGLVEMTRAPRRPAWARLAFPALVVWALAMSVASIVAVRSRADRMQSYVAYLEVCRWMDQNLDPSSRVFVTLLGGAGWLTDLHLEDNGIVSREALAWRRGEMSLEELWRRLPVDHAVILDTGEVPSYFRVVHRSVGDRPREFLVVAFDHDRLDAYVSGRR